MRRALAALALTIFAAPEAQAMDVIAHRGLAGGLPENTLAAFRHAIDSGVAIFEIDLRTTADGALVAMHDATVDRTTNGRGRVSGMTLAEIKALDAGSHAGAAYAGERVPSFAEVLALVRGRPVRVLLDIKRGGGLDLDALVRLIAGQRAEAQVVLGLRSPEDVRRVRALDPAIPIVGFMPSPGQVDAYADAGADMLRLWSDWIEKDEAPLHAIRERGRKVWITIGHRLPATDAAWTALHERLIAAGVDGILTDRPELMPERRP